jgi:hypothetical protein
MRESVPQSERLADPEQALALVKLTETARSPSSFRVNNRRAAFARHTLLDRDRWD